MSEPSIPMREKSSEKWFFSALAMVFLLILLTYLMRPILDPDFFWHLKTGEWIWQNRALPSCDPFNFTGPQQPDSRQLVILQGYWFAQVIYHVLISFFGLGGIFLLRVVLFSLFFALFIWMFEHHCVNRLLSFSLISLFSIFFLENYPLERPQIFTFLGIALLVIFYRKLRDNQYESTSVSLIFSAVFLLMAGWGNMHGGIILGQAAIGVMLVVESITTLKIKDYKRFKIMFLFLGIGLIGSFLSPTSLGLENILSMLGGSTSSFGYSQSQTNYEYYSVYKWIFVKKNFKLLIPVALCITSLFVLKPAFTRKSYVEIVLLIGFWGYAFMHVRYLPIAMTFSLLFIAWNYSKNSFLNYGVGPLLVGLICSLLLWTSNEFKHFDRARVQGFVDHLYMPVQAADFLEQLGYQGRIFNPYNWGGYLLWRLSPSIQVSSDSRLLDLSVAAEMQRCEYGQKNLEGSSCCKEIMDKYAINLAVLPLMDGSNVSLLNQDFAGNMGWKLIFRDQISAIYIRKILLPLAQGT